MSTPKALTVRVDGKNLTGTSTGLTIKDALNELKVSVDKDDRVKPGLAAPVSDGLKIAVQRVSSKTITATEPISHGTVEKSDSALYKGDTKTLTSGKAGAKVVTYKVTTVDGKTESEGRQECHHVPAGDPGRRRRHQDSSDHADHTDHPDGRQQAGRRRSQLGGTGRVRVRW